MFEESRHPLCDDGDVAPPKKQRKPGVDEAVAEVIIANAEMRATEDERAAAARRRADAINRSLDLGATLKEIGEKLGGLSVERVRQMRTARSSSEPKPNA